MIVEALYFLAGIMIVVGALFSLVAAFGIVRLPDLYTRMHSASKAGAVGSGLALLAIALVSFESAVILRALVGIAFFLLTAPISAHLLARAAYIAGYRPAAGFSVDELEKLTTRQSKD